MLAKKIKIFTLFLFYVIFIEINLLKILFKKNKYKKKIYNNSLKLNNLLVLLFIFLIVLNNQ